MHQEGSVFIVLPSSFWLGSMKVELEVHLLAGLACLILLIEKHIINSFGVERYNCTLLFVLHGFLLSFFSLSTVFK
jgi:hypothetical protein